MRRHCLSILFISLLGTALAVLSLTTGCGGGTGGDDDRLTIAVIPKGTAAEFWQSVHAGARTAGKEFDVKIMWQGPQTEIQRDRQIAIVDNFVARKVDGMALAPCDENALLPPIHRVNQAGIPLVIFDSGAATEDYISFVATDNYQGGAVAARKMAELIGGKGDVIVIANEPGSASTMKREDGFKDTVEKEFPDIKVVDMQYAKSDRDIARGVTEDLLIRHPQIVGIYASCEPMTFGAWRALLSQELVGKKKFVGFDSSEALNQALGNGEIDALILQDPFTMGYLAVRSVAEHIRGVPQEKRVDTGVSVVTAGNMDTPEMSKLLNPDLSILDE